MAYADRPRGTDNVLRGETPQARVEMNLTPLIDVLLVLIVIFMTAVTLTEKSIDVTLPGRTQPPGQAPKDSQIVLEYTSDRRLSVNHQEVALDGLEARLRTIYGTRRDKTLYVWGAASLRYRSIVEVLDAAKGAGVDRVGIITEGMRKSR
jgi:biopolymer transport protein ExbD